MNISKRAREDPDSPLNMTYIKLVSDIDAHAHSTTPRTGARRGRPARLTYTYVFIYTLTVHSLQMRFLYLHFPILVVGPVQSACWNSSYILHTQQT